VCHNFTAASTTELVSVHWELWLMMAYIHVLGSFAWTQAIVMLLHIRRHETSDLLMDLYYRMALVRRAES
jgi:hypothetical protein